MPTRKPSTPEGRKLKRQVQSKNVKLKRNKIVEKTTTGKKKTIQRAGKPVKTVKTVKTTTRKSPVLKKKPSSSMKGFRATTTTGTSLGAAAGYGVMRNAQGKGLKVAENTRTKQIGDRVSVSDAMKLNKQPNPKPKGKMPKNPTKYKGSQSGNGINKAVGAAGGAIVGGVMSTLGYAAAKGIKNKLSKGRKVTKKQRIVNGVNKTAQKARVKAQTKTMRAKKRNSRR